MNTPIPTLTPSAQLIVRECADGRVEITVMNCGPQSTPHCLMRLLIATIGEIADVRDLARQFMMGKRQATSIVQLMAVGAEFDLGEADAHAVPVFHPTRVQA